MQHIARALLVLCLSVAVAVWSSSCYGPNPVVSGDLPLRTFYVTSTVENGTAPFTWEYTIVATPGKADLPRSGKSLVTKIEMDFGEGAGLVDVTNDVHDLWDDANLALAHEYAAAGEYLAKCRVTFYDGGVALWTNDNDIVVQ